MNIKELDDILARTNQPMGSSTGRAIANSLRKGNVEEAKTVYSIDGDKLTQYEELNKWVHMNLGCRTHGLINCTCKFCRLDK